MGLAQSFSGSARRLFTALPFAAAAAVLPFKDANAQALVVPITTASSASAKPTKARTADPMVQAALYSNGNAGVGIWITVNETAKRKGYTGEVMRREIIDSLKARGVPAEVFFEDARPGELTLVTAFINRREYKNPNGATEFQFFSFRKEFDNIKAKYLSTPMTAAAPGGKNPAREPE